MSECKQYANAEIEAILAEAVTREKGLRATEGGYADYDWSTANIMGRLAAALSAETERRKSAESALRAVRDAHGMFVPADVPDHFARYPDASGSFVEAACRLAQYVLESAGTTLPEISQTRETPMRPPPPKTCDLPARSPCGDTACERARGYVLPSRPRPGPWSGRND